MRPARSSAARAARPIALCFAVITGGCGGSTATPPATEVDLGRAPGDPESKMLEEEEAAAARAETDESRPPRASKEPPPPVEEPGYLTLVCDPGCDEVSHEGRPLGPSPVERAPLAPGSRLITVSNGGVGHKIITVIIRSGQVNALRIDMGGGGLFVHPMPNPPAPGSSVAAQPGGMGASPSPAMLQQRAQIEPKAWAGKATLDELRLLRALCSFMADRACRDRAAALIKAQTAAPSSSSP